MPRCDNCYAEVPNTELAADGRRICCPHCIFHPLGCRCRFGELGVPETEMIDLGEDDEVGELDGMYPLEESCE